MVNNENNHKKHKMLQYSNGKSLEEVNGTVEIPKGKGFWKTLFAYSGPGALVAVGYMDPGNWSTSITGGQNFQYLLMSVILLSSLIAMLLQYMAAKLGIVSQMDLAQAIRARTSKALGIVLWILTELAIMATDIVLLLLLLTKVGFRKIEAIVVCLIFVILFVFVYQVALSNPDWGAVFKGLIPTSETFAKHPVVHDMSPLNGALGIIGATVMPHNLYLHSAISQTRKFDRNNEDDIANAVRFTAWDSNIQLGLAFVVNSLLLIMGVAVFKSGAVEDPSFFGLYQALSDTSVMSNGLLAAAARTGILSTLFAVALLASGQNSTITGTLTGQVIMEGFIHLRMPLWARRLITRLLSVIPVLICVALTSGKSTIEEHEALNNLMNNSQVFLAFALPFSMLPLVIMTGSKVEMGERFKNRLWINILGWISVISLTYLNMIGLPQNLEPFFPADKVGLAHTVAYILIVLIIALLIWTLVELHLGNKRFAAEQAKKHNK